jgi:heme/copper-type cytochrome/quinol oxidase subunit 2
MHTVRVAFVWLTIAIAGGLFLATLLATYRGRRRMAQPFHASAVIEYAWATVPWVILALCLSPTVQRILRSG